MNQFEGKIVLVTGAARGTGAVVAEKFAAEGAKVVATDVRDGPDIERLDVTSEADWARVVGGLDRVDVLVNNAAILHLGNIEKTPPDVFRRVLEVNCLGPFLGIRAVAPVMRAHGGGAIVNVGSIDSMTGMNGVSAYGTSKWGVRGLTKCVAMELGRDGIRVNTVCPAGGNPEMFADWATSAGAMAESGAAYETNRALPGRVSLGAIADAVLYLASDQSTWISATDLPVDGGAHAGHYIEGMDAL